MAGEELFSEARRLRMDGAAVNARRVDAQCREGGAPGFGAIDEEDVVPDTTWEDYQLGMRDMRGVGSRAAADRHDRVRCTATISMGRGQC